MKFARLMLDNYKRRGRGTQLVCTDCCSMQQAIEAKLKDKKAIRCTCRGQQHSYSNEKCKLPRRKLAKSVALEATSKATMRSRKKITIVVNGRDGGSGKIQILSNSIRAEDEVKKQA